MNNTPIFDKIKRNDEEKPHLSPLIAANLRAACHNELCSLSYTKIKKVLIAAQKY